MRLLQVADDPARRQQVQEAFTKAAETLGLASREAVIALVEELAQELAYIEALRDRLLRRVKGMAEKLNRMAQNYRGDASHLETLTQVRRLTLHGAEADRPPVRRAGCADRRGDGGAAQRRQPADVHPLQPRLAVPHAARLAVAAAEWDVAGIGFDEGILQLLNRSYQFLAPRFMPVTEWASRTRPAKREAGHRSDGWCGDHIRLSLLTARSNCAR